MSFGRLGVVVMLATAAAASGAFTPDAPSSMSPVELCEGLDRVRPFEARHVLVRGVIAQGQEGTFIYDPKCLRNVQPVAAVAITELTVGRAALVDILRTGDAEVVVEGTLSGPRCTPYRPLMPPEDYREWMSPCTRYEGSFRVELFIQRVHSAKVAKRVDVEFWHPTGLQYPIVVGGEMPHYPEAAKVLEIAGVVEAEVRADLGDTKEVGASGFRVD